MFDSKKLEQNMQLLKKGDVNCFDIIYEQTHRMVFYIIYQIVKDHSRSEDVMQNVYMKIYEKIDMYEANTSAKAWIASIARNLAINEYNKHKKETIIDIDDFDYISDDSSQRTETPLIDLASKHLEEDEFLIVMMCVVEGYRRREVAKIVNLSTSGVTWKLDQALKKLRILSEKEV